MANRLAQLSPKALRRAATLKEKIQALEAELNEVLGGKSASPSGAPRRKLSPEARAKIAAGQRRRWAKQKRASA